MDFKVAKKTLLRCSQGDHGKRGEDNILTPPPHGYEQTRQ